MSKTSQTLCYCRYPDLKEAFGNDTRAAARHFVSHGFMEGRFGYIEGGSRGRWTIRSVSDTYRFVSTSERCAGAIDSVTYKGKEFINSYDHGRQLQVLNSCFIIFICKHLFMINLLFICSSYVEVQKLLLLLQYSQHISLFLSLNKCMKY